MQRYSCVDGRVFHVALAVFALAMLIRPAAAQHYRQTNLISDLANPPGGAPQVMDSNLVNPWGVTASPTGPFWVANQGTGTATIYTVNHTTGAVTKSPLVVTIPGSMTGRATGPTGQVFNGTADFVVSSGSTSGPGAFLFAALNGTISGWNSRVGASGSSASTVAETPAAGAPPALYTGLALASRGGSLFLYAANPASGRIDVFDSKFTPVRLPGLLPFGDPDLPPGDVPFNIADIDGLMYVTYEGPVGAVNVFDVNGTLLRRFATGGTLQNPWGIAMAPGQFGKLSRALLIGNFNHSRTAPNGTGWISAFDAQSGAPRGLLDDSKGTRLRSTGCGA